MNKAELFYGFVIGIVASFIGTYIFVVAITKYNYITGVQILSANGQLGQLITLGAICNIIAFFALLHYKKDVMARGVVLATIVLTIVTLFF